MNFNVIKNLAKVTVAALTDDIYMSTRISDNEELGWKRSENERLSYERHKMLKKVLGDVDILNPVVYNQGMPESWTHKDYMKMWRYVLGIMRMRNCKMVAFQEDLPHSIGCSEEITLGLRTIILKGGIYHGKLFNA